MRSLFESNASTNKTIAKLCDRVKQETVAHEGNDDPTWADSVIKALAKKLKKGKYLDELLKAIINEDRLTDCCTIPRSQHELKAVDNCRYPFAKKADLICINPWHYEPVHAQAPELYLALPPVVVHKSRGYYPIVSLEHASHGGYSLFSPNSLSTVMDDRAPNTIIHIDEMRSHLMSEENSPTSSYLGSPTTSSPPPRILPPSSSVSSNLDDRVGPSSGISQPSRFFTDWNYAFMRITFVLLICCKILSYSHPVSSPLSPQSYLSEDHEEHQMMDVDGQETSNSSPPILRPTGMSMVSELIEYCEPDSWMSITYYEEGKRVGDPFDVKSHYLLVDGYPSPSTEERFCLGYFDVENRSQSVINARRLVGRGARFYYIGGEVYCECLSEAAVFVQSPNCNQRHGWHPSTVCKIPPRCNLKIFNNAEFAAQLAESVEKGFEAVYALTRLCTIRISFVKGWGSDYRRQTVCF
uniref:Mothers against decapentaplegic homolog n=1 Tax=Heterorhabditis bacteriophora TaxID=37862 RepID=A0A1I7XF74_HETBA